MSEDGGPPPATRGRRVPDPRASGAASPTAPLSDLDTGVLRRLDADGLEALAGVLAARSAAALADVAARGGPPVDVHLEDLRRLLVRRERRPTLRRRRQIRQAVEAARRGRPDPVALADRLTLVRDLRELDRAIARGARVGHCA